MASFYEFERQNAKEFALYIKFFSAVFERQKQHEQANLMISP